MLTEHGPDINFIKTNELHSVISLHVFSEYIGGSLNYCSQYILELDHDLLFVLLRITNSSSKTIFFNCMFKL